jgi:uncharacterized RDD family membrane protein YckC
VTGPRPIRNQRAAALQGARAGFVSRIAADAIDFLVLQGLFFGCLLSVAVVRFLWNQGDFVLLAPDPWVTVVMQWTLLVLYLGTGWASTGRTVGKTILGLRVVGTRGAPLHAVRAFARAAICASFYPGLLWILVSPRNAALQDIAVRSKVLYEWHSPEETETSAAEFRAP